jgi:hypothetical protein
MWPHGVDFKMLIDLCLVGPNDEEFAMKLTKLFAIVGLCFGIFSNGASAYEQTFAKPKQGGIRIDWCYSWGIACGLPAAEQFCQAKGFAHHTDFVEDVDIGSSGIPTIVQSTGQICNAPNCDGFTYITCVKPDLPPPPPPAPPPPGPGPSSDDTHLYKKPKIGGARLNYCFKKGNGCDGQTAADAYCDAKGYDDAADFNQSAPLTVFVPTRYIGNGKISKEAVSFSFSDITCENN